MNEGIRTVLAMPMRKRKTARPDAPRIPGHIGIQMSRAPMRRRTSLRVMAGGILLFYALTTTATAELPLSFILHKSPKPIASIEFEDDQGRPRNLAEFRGKIVLLNIWATWCVPCRLEMPSLDRLQQTLGGTDFEVLPLSIDRGGIAVVRKFYAEVGLRGLPIYIDTAGKATRKLGTIGVPATLLIDRAGRELGRVIGPAEWDEPDIVQFLKRVIAQKTGSVAPMNPLACADDRAAPSNHPSTRTGGST